MALMRGVYSDETWKTRYRRYNRMNLMFLDLKAKGLVSTTSPKTMTSEDVRTYIIERKKQVQASDLVQDINALNKLCLYLDNNAVTTCLVKNPSLKPNTRGRKRIPSMENSMYERILARSKEIEPTDTKLVTAYAMVLLYIGTGARNKEIRLANVEDLDTDDWVLNLIHVKGEATYGSERAVPVPPEIHELLLTYLLVRKRWCASKNCYSPALFPSKNPDNPYLTSNSIRRIKCVVEEDLNIKFDLRMCRRTFGQRYLDKGLDIESTSVLMGHASTKTTEGFYSRRKLSQAIEKARNLSE